MQEVFYEESVDTHNLSAAKRRYLIYKIFSILSVVLGVFSLLNVLFGQIDPEQGITKSVVIYIVMWLVFAALMFFLAVFLAKKKHAFYLSYDYTFVSGDLRISKVFHGRKRKHLYTISTDRIIKMGRVGSDSYAKAKASPDTKEDILTPNVEAEEDKEFFYIHAQTNVGKKILVLECRIQMIYTILRFMNRPNILETEFNKQTIAAKTASKQN